MRSTLLSCATLALAALSLAKPAHPQTPYLVKDIDPSGSGVSDVVGAAGDRLVFNADGGLWVTEGTDASTRLIYPELELWRQTHLELGGRLIAGPLGPLGTNGGVWSTDGSGEGTLSISPSSFDFVNAGIARDGVAVYRTDFLPWTTDGSLTGTFRIPSPVGFTRPDPNLAPGWVDTFRGRFAIAITDQAAGESQIWLYDPVSRRTSLADRTTSGLNESIKAAGERMFILRSGELWTSEGSASTTRFVAVVPSGTPLGAFSSTFVTLGHHVYFLRQDTGVPRLWRSDGTAGGTVPFSSIAPAAADLNTVFAVASGPLLYFIASNPAQGRELWRTDGTASGTFLLRDIDPGPGSGIKPDALPLAAAGGLIFRAGTPATGQELWRTDGTSAGTVPLPEIAPGPEPALGWHLVRAGNRVYTKANDGVHGDELWAIDLPAGAVAVDDAAASEGVDPPSIRFRVRLESAADQAITVSYTTATGTAQPGTDFVAQAGTLTFAPGAREAFVDVAIVDDGADEPDESFELAVTTVKGAPISDGRAFGVIVDDDGARVSASGTSVVEGNSGAVDAVFPITLTTGDGQPTPHPVTVRARVILGTAGEQDFPPLPAPPSPVPYSSVTFPSGSASGTTLPLAVPVQGDTLDEPNETFSLDFDALNDAIVPEPGTVTGVILDDDGVTANPPIELTHGARIVADLAPPAGRTSDVDFYLVQQHADASYEVVVDGISGDALPLLVSRVHPIGSALQWAQPIGTGNSVAMSWVGIGTLATEHVRVESAGCGSACGSDDTYRLRFYETTLAAPRINNQGGQVTAVILQNTTTSPAAAVLTGWRADGAFGFRSAVVTIPPRGTAVVDTTQEFAGFVGSLTVAHTAPYGALVGKVVALDPAIGLAFDTPLRIKPR